MKKHTLTTKHTDWEAFANKLCSKEGINPRMENGEKTWTCYHDHRRTVEILTRHFPHICIDKTILYFQHNGGYCDCEVIFNVDKEEV